VAIFVTLDINYSIRWIDIPSSVWTPQLHGIHALRRRRCMYL